MHPTPDFCDDGYATRPLARREVESGVLVQSISNGMQKQPGFVDEVIRVVETRGRALEIELRGRRNRRPRWVDCRRRRVHVYAIPWAECKHQLTATYPWLRARWTKRLNWTAHDLAHVYRSVKNAVARGRAHRAPHGARQSSGTVAVRFVSSDMWQPYLRIATKRAVAARRVLNRCHVMAHLSEALEESEPHQPAPSRPAASPPVLTKGRWPLLKAPGESPRVSATHPLARNPDHLGRPLQTTLRDERLVFWTYHCPT